MILKRVILTLVLICVSIFSFSQEENRWKTFFERAITLNEAKNFKAAEEQFKQSQNLLLAEFGLNDATNPTYCHILYRRAHNLFQIDELVDSSYVCFKELYDLSKTPVDTISGNWFRIESLIMLTTIDFERGKIRECCELLEKEKQMVDNLDESNHLHQKYYFYKILAKVYDHVLVNVLSDIEFDPQFINSQYVIGRNGSFYEEYISVFKELVNLSEKFNKGNFKRKTEDYILLANNCRIPDYDHLAGEIFEKAFSMWDNTDNHNDITYLRLCKSFLSWCNKTYDLSLLKQKITNEFDEILGIDSISDSLPFIDFMDICSVRIPDESLNDTLKEKFVNKICKELVDINKYLIPHLIGDDLPSNPILKRINNIKILIKYISLCSIYYYNLGDNSMADLLLNKAKYYSFLLPVADRLLIEELNSAIAKSAETIGDEETNYSYKAINITAKIAKGVLPSSKDWLLIVNHEDNDSRIAKIEEGINLYGTGKYDKDLLEFYLNLAEIHLKNNDNSLANENISITDSIISLMMKDGDVIPDSILSKFFLCKARQAFYKGDIANAKLYATKSNESICNIEAVDFLAELSSNINELDSIVNTQYSITKSFIQDRYPYLSEKERIAFSNSKQFQWFSNIPRYADKHPNDALLLSLAYNTSLISKGTNISVSTEIIKKARERDINTTPNAYDDYMHLYAVAINDTNDVKHNNLNFLLEVLEKDMQHSSGVSSHYLERYWSSWEDITAKLSENEIAVEFVEYVPLESDSNYLYLGAIYLTKNSSPHILRICKVNEIDNLKTQIKKEGLNCFYKLYNIFWLPILKEAPNTKKIWFSPSTHLYQTNIEWALPDSIDVFRVSSTRNILSLNDRPDFNTVALFGGLNYDEKDIKESNDIPNYTAYNIIRGSNIDEERVGLTYLQGSLNEVVSAQSILSKTYHNILFFVGREGTEECFKNLSGKGVSLLHIATHGFYVNNVDEFNYVGNRVMRKSGLFMSGAKVIWKGADEKYFGDDGILLSEEIETLDFSKLNLVILSACGTGLGAPTNDGVYGLQRAFKKAGAQTIIMSLWNVDDNATALMMETFYQELEKTSSKHLAFQKAQKTVREKFGDPYYWAAFIMLD